MKNGKMRKVMITTMKTTLIKIQDKFILVSDENAKNNELLYNLENNTICRAIGDAEVSHFKIIAGVEFLPKVDFSLLSDEDCKRIGYVDVEKLANNIFPIINKTFYDKYDDGVIERSWEEDINEDSKIGFIEGFKTAQSLNDKMFSLEDMRNAFLSGCHNMTDYVENESESEDYDIYEEANIFIQSLQKTEWDVEVEMEEYAYEPILGKFPNYKANPNPRLFRPKITNNSIKITKIL